MNSIDELIIAARDAWDQASNACPDRDHEGEKLNPGQGPLCQRADNDNCMGWCDADSCPRPDGIGATND